MQYPDDRQYTPQMVLIDTLEAANQMASIDWKEEEPEVREQVNRILAAKSFPYELSFDDQYEPGIDTGKLLSLINQYELWPAGYSLEVFDTNSDSYTFTIISTAQQPEVAALFAQLKP